MKVLAKKLVKSSKTYDIRCAREAFEPVYHLSAKKVIARLDWCGDIELIPFQEFVRKREVSPKWWRAYQEVKHNWTRGFDKANLKNTLEALAGAFLLNAIHFPSVKVLNILGFYHCGAKKRKRIREGSHAFSHA